MLTDENANTYDQVDLAPHRWRKPAQPPMEPLRKPTAGKKNLNWLYKFTNSIVASQLTSCHYVLRILIK